LVQISVGQNSCAVRRFDRPLPEPCNRHLYTGPSKDIDRSDRLYIFKAVGQNDQGSCRYDIFLASMR
jgi:hypothetical protein